MYILKSNALMYGISRIGCRSIMFPVQSRPSARLHGAVTSVETGGIC